jgi:arylsulfatase A-like enzyme
VLIFADDLGYADLGVHGSADMLTPHIDRLAREGARCLSGYVTAPQCTPTRAGILTGRSQCRFGMEMNVPPGYSVSEDERAAGKPLAGMPTGEVTIAERLSEAGYATGIVGKWHLGEEEVFHPMRRGFDEFYGFLGGGSRYLPGRRSPLVERNGESEICKEYMTDALSKEAVAFIERHAQEPFFLYLSYNCPHMPMEAKPADLKRFADIADENRRTLAAMMYSMDEGVGRVLAALKASGLDEQTLVFFISDNGGQTPKNASLNLPFTGKKGDLLEGGIRIPFFARWPGTIPAGSLLDEPVSSLDVCATALALAGVGVAPELDGLDLSAYLRGEVDALPARALFWRFGEQRAVRRGDWKLFAYGEELSVLFDLSVDPAEQNDLAQEQPALVEELRGIYAAWEGELAPRLWNPPMNHAVKLASLRASLGLRGR